MESGMEFAVPGRRRAHEDTLGALADEERGAAWGSDGRLDAAFYDRPDSVRTYAASASSASSSNGAREQRDADADAEHGRANANARALGALVYSPRAPQEVDEMSPRTVVGDGAEERARDADARRRRQQQQQGSHVHGNGGTSSAGSVGAASLGVGEGRGLSFGSVREDARQVGVGGALGEAWRSGSGETLGGAARG
jgi:hypothetical protein